jgi:hypothetical protein
MTVASHFGGRVSEKPGFIFDELRSERIGRSRVETKWGVHPRVKTGGFQRGTDRDALLGVRAAVGCSGFEIRFPLSL